MHFNKQNTKQNENIKKIRPTNKSVYNCNVNTFDNYNCHDINSRLKRPLNTLKQKQNDKL